MATKAVATVEPAGLPDLVQTPSVVAEISAEDITLPRVYLGQFSSEAVKEDLVPSGCVYTASGPDDGDPQVLWEKDGGEGVLFHVLALRKGKSASVDGELERFAFDDPDAPADSWVTYNYFVVLPEVDTEVPYKLLLTKTGKPAAQSINMVLRKRAEDGPSYLNAFRLTTAPRKNPKGSYFVARVVQVEANDEHVKLCSDLALMASGQSAEVQATGEEPAI